MSQWPFAPLPLPAGAVYEALAVLWGGFMVLRLGVIATNWLFPSRLQAPPERHEHKPTGRISVLIPARNEGHNLPDALAALLPLVRNGTLAEIIVLDDHSTDDTAAVVLTARQHCPLVQLLPGEPLPPGWTGKNWACHQLACRAKGQWLLFLDADVQVTEALPNALLHEAERHRLTLLSVFPDQQMHTAGEKAVVSAMAYLLLTMLPLRLVRATRTPSLAAANGQVMFFRAEAYKNGQFHQQVRSRIAEDIGIARLVKKQGHRAAVCLGGGLVRCRMYHSYAQALDGFSKNMLEGFGNIVPLLVAYLLLIGPVAVWISTWYPLMGLAALGYVALTNLLISRLTQRPVAELLRFHVPMVLNILRIGVRAIGKKATGQIEWKDRKITLDGPQP